VSASTGPAGPFFDAPEMDFHNLQLADTSIVDHHTCQLARAFDCGFKIV